MVERCDAQAYRPEVVKLMKEAFARAQIEAATVENDAALTRKLIASAILDQVNAGVRDEDQIVAAVVAALAVARNVAG